MEQVLPACYTSNADQVRLGGVELDPRRHMCLAFKIGETEISAALPPHRTADDDAYVVGIEEAIDAEGNRVRTYLKIPSRLREAGQVLVQYYDSHENLRKGAVAIGIAAGFIVVGSLTVLRLKKSYR